MKNKILKVVTRAPRKVEVFSINIYQKYISKSFGKRCIFYPTCSEYTKQAVDKYGIIKGNILGIKRILKCNPFSSGGVDYLK
ncbi:MAG: membrane protein insertion efficiency factor YidD [Clostridia bacterium]